MLTLEMEFKPPTVTIPTKAEIMAHEANGDMPNIILLASTMEFT